MNGIRVLQISGDWVANQELGGLTETFGRDQDPPTVRDLQGSFMITFPEIEDRAESVYAIPGVLDWFRRLYTAVPHMPYFLHPFPFAGALQSLLLAGMEGEARANATETGAVPVEGPTLGWLMSRLVATAEYATDMGDDWELVVRQFVLPLGDNAVERLVQEVSQRLPEY